MIALHEDNAVFNLETSSWVGIQTTYTVRHNNAIQQCATCFDYQNHYQAPSLQNFKNINIFSSCHFFVSEISLMYCYISLWIKPTDVLNSNFNGITTLHISGGLLLVVNGHHNCIKVPKPKYG